MNDPSTDSNRVPEAAELAILQAQMQRPAQSINIDGSFELGWGAMLLCLGFAPYFNAILPKTVYASPWTAWIAFLPLVCGAFAPYAVPRLIKKYITWPRTGYVANPNEVKLAQLVRLMVFGAALGLAITLPFILVSDLTRPAAQRDMHRVILHGVEFLICAAVAVCLGRKVVTKRRPLPGAYDATVVKQALSQTAVGRKTLRGVKTTLLLMFAGVPILMFGVALGLMYLSRSAPAEMSRPEMGVLIFLVAANAVLYLMSNGFALMQHRWKWLVVLFMLILPVFVIPRLPYPVGSLEPIPLFKLVLPLSLTIGLVWCLSGVATLVLFMRHNPPPGTEDQ